MSVFIIPKPRSVELVNGSFSINSKTKIISLENTIDIAMVLKSTLLNSTGYEMEVSRSNEKNENNIFLSINEKFEPEEYCIEILEKNVIIKGGDFRGVVWGVQSFLQLLGPESYSPEKIEKDWTVGCCIINDKPRFNWRGFMLDVSRHMFGFNELCKFIDLLSIHKYNVFHLHLTDDQGWRVEIKKYPKLIEKGGFRNETLIGHYYDKPHKFDGKRYGGYYSQDELKALVKYASDRGITIVPEIDMPGHMQAAISAYPELGCTDMTTTPRTIWGVSQNILNVKDSTLEFVKDVLDEILEIFPSEYIHIGGDEAHKYFWEESKEVQTKMAEVGAKNEEELQGWFMIQIVNHLKSKGRKAIGWDEILESGIDDGIAITSWQNEKGGVEATNRGLNAIMTPQQFTYFDHYQKDPNEDRLCIGGCTTLEKVYHYEPIPAEVAKDKEHLIKGTQGQLWTEYIKTFDELILMGYPRATALAEVAWCPKDDKDWEEFMQRLNEFKKIYELLELNYCK